MSVIIIIIIIIIITLPEYYSLYRGNALILKTSRTRYFFLILAENKKKGDFTVIQKIKNRCCYCLGRERAGYDASISNIRWGRK